MNNDSYIYAVLNDLGLAITPARVNFLRAWAAQENTTALNNPFADTLDAEPARTDKYVGGYWFNYNGRYPVKNYSSQAIGVKAFTTTLKYYPSIYNGLVSGLPFDQWNNAANLIAAFQLYGGDAYYYNKVYSLYMNTYKDQPVNSGSFAGFGWILGLLLAGQIFKYIQRGHHPA